MDVMEFKRFNGFKLAIKIKKKRFVKICKKKKRKREGFVM